MIEMKQAFKLQLLSLQSTGAKRVFYGLRVE